MDDERFNPYTEAIANVRAGLGDLLNHTPPPRQIREQVDEFDRRVSDPAALPEWIAIYERHGPEGLADYMRKLRRTKERWGL